MKPLSRATRLYLAGLVILILALLVFVQAAFDLTPRISPTDPGQILPLYVLSTSITLILIVFGFILARNLFKLWMDKKTGRPGSQFRTRLVLSMMSLTLIPAAVLFVFATGLVNRSIDKWFSRPVDVMFEVADRFEAQREAREQERIEGIATHLASQVPGDLDRAARDLGLDAIVILDASTGEILQATGSPDDVQVLASPDRAGIGGRATQDGRMMDSLRVSGSGEDFRDLEIAIIDGGDPTFERFRTAFTNERSNYDDLRLNRTFYRDTYVLISVLITILVLFAAVWTGLYLSRRITLPIEALSGATREISAGNLDHRVSAQADDELGVLVGLFNDMADQLQTTSNELDERRRYTEIILESIPTGVVSIHDDYSVARINRAARTMFSIERPETLQEVFDRDDLDQIGELLERCRLEGTCTREMTLTTHDRPVHSAVIATRLRTEGFVLVVEDLTELVKAQTASAWREVARRLAHEIRNPLTPIQLSAERIARNVERMKDREPRTVAIVGECVDAIIGEVDSLQELVDEFQRVARLPAISKRPTQIKHLVERTMSLYEDRFNGTRVSWSVPEDLPQVSMDPQQIKRVLINLIDNALEAMAGAGRRELRVDCELIAERGVVQIRVSDSGHGISPEDRERLFSPYFSTRKDGTGLGLAISSRIVSDHGGSIDAESDGTGARFIVELPI